MNDTTVARMVLAAQTDGQTALFQSLLLFGGLLLVLILAFVFVLHLRQRLRREEPGEFGVMSLDNLQRLRDCGELTIGEYERLREKAIDAMTPGASSESGGPAR